jgi:hypothetical protein
MGRLRQPFCENPLRAAVRVVKESAHLQLDTNRDALPGKIVQAATIPAMNPVRPPLANGTTSVCSCRPQNHDDPVPALNLQLIQYNLGAFRQHCPLSHSELRGIARSCPSSTPNLSAGKVPTLVHQMCH